MHTTQVTPITLRDFEELLSSAESIGVPIGIAAHTFSKPSLVTALMFRARRILGPEDRYEVWFETMLLEPLPHQSGRYTWGYYGQGTANLAELLLYHCFGKETLKDSDLITRLMYVLVSQLPRDSGWDLSIAELASVVREQCIQQERNIPPRPQPERSNCPHCKMQLIR